MDETSAVCSFLPLMCKSFRSECHEYVWPHPSMWKELLSLGKLSNAKPLTSDELHPKTLPSAQRFDFADDEQLSELSKGLIPEITSKSNKWALKVFDQWRDARNQRYTDVFLSTNDPASLNTYLSKFAV